MLLILRICPDAIIHDTAALTADSGPVATFDSVWHTRSAPGSPCRVTPWASRTTLKTLPARQTLTELEESLPRLPSTMKAAVKAHSRTCKRHSKAGTSAGTMKPPKERRSKANGQATR